LENLIADREYYHQEAVLALKDLATMVTVIVEFVIVRPQTITSLEESLA